MPNLSESVQRYLITIHRLTSPQSEASTKDIATRLGVRLPSVSQKIRRLAEQGYVNYEWRGGISLTEQGNRIAHHLLRKHRLLETFLYEIMDYALHEIHVEASAMEYALSDRFVDGLDKRLNYPKIDPHGHPIPGPDGSTPMVTSSPLSTAIPETTYTITTIDDHDELALRYLCARNLVPKTDVTILEISTIDGTLTLQVGQNIVAIGQILAQAIGVRLAE